MDEISYKLFMKKEEIDNIENVLKFTINTQLSIKENIGDYKKNICCDDNQRGCCLSIDNYQLYICHSHLFDILDVFHKLLNEMDNSQIALVELFNIRLLVNKSKAIYIRKNIYDYLYEVFKLHHDTMFYNNNLSNNQKAVVAFFEDRYKKEKSEIKYIQTLSLGQKQHYLIKKALINKVQDCAYYDKILYYPKKNALEFPVTSITAYSSVRDIKCKSSKHKSNTFAVLSLMTQRDDCFVFSYCEDCLYNYYSVLYLAYTNYDEEEFIVGNFKIYHKPNHETCFFTGINEPRMYQIFHNNVSFFVCQSGFEMLFKTIINSAAFQELYPSEAEKAQIIINQNEEKQYDKTVCELQDTINILSEKNLNLKKQNVALNHKINHIDDLLKERKIIKASKIDDEVLNCLLLDNSMHLSVKRKVARKSSNKDFKITYVSGIECKTIDHFPKNDLVILLEINRENEVFKVALCKSCVDHILQGIDTVKNKRTDFINDFVKFKILTAYNGAHHCYKCGNTLKRMYNISLCNVDLTLCPSCLYKLENTLKDAKETFKLISHIGGMEFIRNGVLDLKIEK